MVTGGGRSDLGCLMANNPESRSYSRRSAGVLLLVGVLTGVTVGGGVGVIAASSTKSVTVCANKKTNVLRYASNGKCVAKTETKVVLNQTGADGMSGAAGAKGDTGTKGDTGAAGTKGDTGATGTKGDTGAAGTKGDTGATGTNGALTNSQIKNICGVNGATACAVGLQGPGGGIVFMTPSTLGNTTGLFYEAAPSTWSSPSGDPTSAWCNNTNTLLGVSSALFTTGAMDGANKTAVMLGVCTSGAANLADAYTVTVNGVVYGDWFLPSKGELNQMYVNETAVGGFASGSYWSSSEGDANGAWLQLFDIGGQDYFLKSLPFYVRPVRAF
jgi:Collagen triple helix repeat (20 copies)